MVFSPKRKGENTFEGDCWVHDPTWAIQKMTLHLRRDANINFIDKLSLIQEFKMINDSKADWFHVDVMDGVFVPNISFGFPVLKGDFLSSEIEKYVKKSNWELQTNFHFGGYAKYNQTLIRFINDFKKDTNVLLDPIYTAKMIFGLLEIIKNDGFQKGSKILAIHTGGLQGIQGVNQKLQKNNEEIIHL